MDEGQQRELEMQIKSVEKMIVDLRARWPAHSLKPAMMAELEDLEEERDRLQRLLDQARESLSQDLKGEAQEEST